MRVTPCPRIVQAALALSLVALALMPRVAAAQAGTSALQGRVTDTQGGVLPGVTVVLSHVGTGAERETVSNETGIYQFLAVPPGRYSLRAELTGFRTALVEQVDLQVDATSRADVVLTVGDIAETIQVTAETPVINTTDASLGNVISGEQIRELPMEGRNVVGLLALQPGVTFVPRTNPDSMDPRYGAVSGARADQSTTTLDGVDVNDQEEQTAFTSALRVTLDSVEEFRVTTSNYGADQGRAAGAQVSLVTRSGTNQLRGAGYWSNRDTRFSSNEYFLKLSQHQAGEESEAPLLNRDIYGFSLGGPVRRDRMFYFLNFEGLDENREQVVTRSVPTASFRDGVLIYQCENQGECPARTVAGLTGSHQVPAGFYGMTPDEIRRVDPLGIGPNLAAMQHFRQYPVNNAPGSYPHNIESFRFASPVQNDFRTYTGRVDLRPNGSHSLFGRFVIQDDDVAAPAQFPDQVPNSITGNSNWGVAIGHDWVLGHNKINTLRYGYTLIDQGDTGLQTSNAISMRFISDFDALTDTFSRNLSTQNLVNDFSWILGSHTLKFGANIRWIRNDTLDNSQSYHIFSSNPSWTANQGQTYMPGGECPPPADCSGLPAVASAGRSGYSDPFIHMLGVLSQTTSRYNFTVDGQTLPVGEPVPRLFAAEEYDFYIQNSWQVRHNVTLTAGVRYSLYSPPYEARGQQVAPVGGLGAWFAERERNMLAGLPSNAVPLITFEPAGPKNNARGYYDWDTNNFGPRVSAAWSLDGRTVLRGGYSLVYDRIGSGIASAFNAGGSFGLSTELGTPFGTVNEDDPTARFQGLGAEPTQLLQPAPQAGFPQTPPPFAGEITQSLDDGITTPRSHVFNVTFGRDLGGGFGIEASYVGRLGRNQLVRRDMAMPLNLVDPDSGMDYFTAAQLAINAARGGIDNMAPIPYWENLFPDAAGNGRTATQAMAAEFVRRAPDYITTLFLADQFCFPACSRFGEFAYFSQQYDALAARSTIGRSEYDAMQLSLQKRFSRGYQMAFNYTAARAKDHASQVERGASFAQFGAGGYSGFLVNTWEPDRAYSYSDYDVRHQFNVNWLAELPFGQGKPWGSNAGGVTEAIIGGWSLAGLVRWTSGFPFNVLASRCCWATNWNLQGNSELVDPGRLPQTSRTKDVINGQPSPFADPEDALTFFRRPLPGETGIRNQLRGDGYFSIDASLGKSFRMPFGHRLRFRWDVYNLTNTPRFDTTNVEMAPDRAASFGQYLGGLTACDGAAGRCMQANLRYEF